MKRMGDDEFHHEPSRPRLFAEAKRARESEDALFQAMLRVESLCKGILDADPLDTSVRAVTDLAERALAVARAAR